MPPATRQYDAYTEQLFQWIDIQRTAVLGDGFTNRFQS